MLHPNQNLSRSVIFQNWFPFSIHKFSCFKEVHVKNQIYLNHQFHVKIIHSNAEFKKTPQNNKLSPPNTPSTALYNNPLNTTNSLFVDLNLDIVTYRTDHHTLRIRPLQRAMLLLPLALRIVA